MKSFSKVYKITAWTIGTIIYLFVFVVVAKSYLLANPYIDLQIPSQMVCKLSQKQIEITVGLKNKTNYNLDSRDRYFLSYHLLDAEGNMLKFDNPRTNLPLITPGKSVNIPMQVQIPKMPGEYQIEIDVVQEGVFWYKDKGNKTAIGKLIVE